ncbi:MAG: hypothetical protein AAGI46_15435 [Planctomycetota bacterium]
MRPAFEFDPPVRQTRLFHSSSRVPSHALRLAATAFAASLLAVATPTVAVPTADDPAVASVGSGMLAARQFAGIAAREGVVVRAGPSAGDVEVTTLGEGAEVTVIARQASYLRILPPDGTFCLVPKSRVDVRGTIAEGPQTGRVSESLSVRVGSTLDDNNIGRTAARLRTGDVVRVLGEQGIYYRIEPPKMVFFYVPVAEMRKGRELVVAETPAGWDVNELPIAAAEVEPSLPVEPEVETPEPVAVTPEPVIIEEPEVEPEIVIDEPEAQPAEAEVIEPLPVAIEEPAIDPTWIERFESTDTLYREQAELPLEDQPLEELEARYAELLAEARASELRGIQELAPVVEARLRTVTIRREALADLEAIRQLREGVDERRAALVAEREELSERVEMGKIKLYEAVGELQPSSLQITGGTLFRLVDPQSKRTLIYLRCDGEIVEQIAGKLQKFIGVRGEVGRDEMLKLKYVRVTGIDRVNPSDVFGSVAAKLIPPSMVQPGEVASASE